MNTKCVCGAIHCETCGNPVDKTRELLELLETERERSAKLVEALHLAQGSVEGHISRAAREALAAWREGEKV